MMLKHDTITYHRLSSSKESENYKTQNKILRMQFSCKEKPKLCIKICLKPQANYDTLTNHFLHGKYFHIMTLK